MERHKREKPERSEEVRKGRTWKETKTYRRKEH
jgi:hypothetical protein